MSNLVLTLRKLVISAVDTSDQEELEKLQRADRYAADIVVGGVLLGREATDERLVQAIDAHAGETFCECRNCEGAFSVSLSRSESAFYIGLAAGLRLARAMDAEEGAR